MPIKGTVHTQAKSRVSIETRKLRLSTWECDFLGINIPNVHAPIHQEIQLSSLFSDLPHLPLFDDNEKGYNLKKYILSAISNNFLKMSPSRLVKWETGNWFPTGNRFRKRITGYQIFISNLLTVHYACIRNCDSRLSISPECVPFTGVTGVGLPVWA